ncbi:MAG: hypothetical protein M0Q38_00905 [Bacteroidales bacterium]|jgi:hypothetical protein|nr:hypothetical protein [Bacteroidales bacterium]
MGKDQITKIEDLLKCRDIIKDVILTGDQNVFSEFREKQTEYQLGSVGEVKSGGN